MTSSSSSPVIAPRIELWVVRHGERIDETTEGNAWYHATDQSRRFDPFLTEAGKCQARAAGATLRRLIVAQSDYEEADDDGPIFERIYCSPMQRCLATAHALLSGQDKQPPQRARSLGNRVIVVPGIAECAAAAREARGGVLGLSFLKPGEMRAMCPEIQTDDDCWASSAPVTYEEAVKWAVRQELERAVAGATGELMDLAELAEQPTPQRRVVRVLVVAHREGIRDLMGRHLRLPYCCIGSFNAERKGGHQPAKTKAANALEAAMLTGSAWYIEAGVKDGPAGSSAEGDLGDVVESGGESSDENEEGSNGGEERDFRFELSLLVEPYEGAPV